MEHEKRKYAINQVGNVKYDRLSYMREFFQFNKAYLHARAGGQDDPVLLERLRSRYEWYRNGWRGIPAEAIQQKYGREFVSKMGTPPLCVDIETAAVCDLACPFCFRQATVTPDKMMNPDLAYRIIDQAAEMGVPSMKFNWRGEPLMNPETPKLIAYAKKKGILETLVNTNATHLTKQKAEELIDAGLDILIYSFDGGTAETYNKNRPGRFKSNDFETVYKNIVQMADIRRTKGAMFPFTKIQMIITKDTYVEEKSFYKLFQDCVDEVTTGIYMERGGHLDILSPADKEIVMNGPLKGKEDIEGFEFWKGSDGTLYMADGRIPCEQIFQRMMVSYDGRVFMCCYDWGNEHPVGFVSEQSFAHGDEDYDVVLKKIQSKSKGFDMMAPRMPSRNVRTPQQVQTLKDIWDGTQMRAVRERHVNNRVESTEICKKCTFIETYRWKSISIDPKAQETRITLDATN